MANVKTVQIRRNLAPNAYYLEMQVNERLMQEYDTQTGAWTPAVTERDTWRTLITAQVKRVSMDGTTSGEQIGLASYQYLFRIAGETEWKDLSAIPATNGRQQLNSLYGGGYIYLRHCANIPAGVTYEVKCVAVVADEDIRQNVTVESDIYRIGCNDKTLDEIRFKLVRGQQNIIYNPEAPAPYTVEGLERATFLQQVEFEVTKGGKKFASDEYVVTAIDLRSSQEDEGVALTYDFTKWLVLYVENNTAPTAETDQIGNSVHFVDRYIGLHSDTWAINKGGLFTYAAGARSMDILWKRGINSIKLYLMDGNSGAAPSESWVTLATKGVGEISYDVGTDSMTATVMITNNPDSITGRGITLTVARNLVITKIVIDGIDAEDVMTMAGPYRFFGRYIRDAKFSEALMANSCTRHSLQKLEAANGNVTVTMDCGSGNTGATVLRLYNKDKTVLYDERVISFQRKMPQLEVSVENLPFVESKKNTTQKMCVRLFAEGHEVTEYGYYEMAGAVKKADGDTGSLALSQLSGGDCFRFELTGTAEGTVTFEPKMRERLEIL